LTPSPKEKRRGKTILANKHDMTLFDEDEDDHEN